MKRRHCVYMCAPDDRIATDEQWRSATDYITLIKRRDFPNLFSASFLMRPTLRSALRFALRAYRATGCPMIVQRRSGKRRERTWEVTQ